MTINNQVDEIKSRGFENRALVSDDLENEDAEVIKDDTIIDMDNKKNERDDEDLSDLGSVTSLESSASGSPRFHLKMSPVPRRNRKKHSVDPSHSPVSFRSGYQSNRSSISSVRKGILKKTNSCTTINMEMNNISRPDSPTENGFAFKSTESIEDTHSSGDHTRFARTKDNPHLHHQRSFNRVKFILDSGRPDNITGDYDDIKIEKNNDKFDRCDKLKSNEKEEAVGLSHSGRKCLGFSAGLLLLTMAVILGSFFGSRKSALSPKALANSGPNFNKRIASALEGKFKILNQEFVPTLYDSKSSEFRKISQSLENVIIKAIFVDQAVNQRNSTIKLKVVKYEKGSVIAVFRTKWEGPPTIKLSELRKRILKHLAKYGAFGEYKVDKASFTISELRDLCVGNPQSCSHICYLNEDTLRFGCTCPDTLILINNTHCISPKLTTTTAKNPVLIPNIINEVLKVSNAQLFAVNQEKKGNSETSAEKGSSKQESPRTSKSSPKNSTHIPQTSQANITTKVLATNLKPSSTSETLLTPNTTDSPASTTPLITTTNASTHIHEGLVETKSKPQNDSVPESKKETLSSNHQLQEEDKLSKNSSVVNSTSIPINSKEQIDRKFSSSTIPSSKVSNSSLASSPEPENVSNLKDIKGNINETLKESNEKESNILTKEKAQPNIEDATVQISKDNNQDPKDHKDTLSSEINENEPDESQILPPTTSKEDIITNNNITVQVSLNNDVSENAEDIKELSPTVTSNPSNVLQDKGNKTLINTANITTNSEILQQSNESFSHSVDTRDEINLSKTPLPVVTKIDNEAPKESLDSWNNNELHQNTSVTDNIITSSSKHNTSESTYIKQNDSLESINSNLVNNQLNITNEEEIATQSPRLILTTLIPTSEKSQPESIKEVSSEASMETKSHTNFNKSSTVIISSTNNDTESIQSDDDKVSLSVNTVNSNKISTSSTERSNTDSEIPRNSNSNVTQTSVEENTINQKKTNSTTSPPEFSINTSHHVTTSISNLETKTNLTETTYSSTTTVTPEKTHSHPLKEIVTIQGTPMTTQKSKIESHQLLKNHTEKFEVNSVNQSTNSLMNETMLDKPLNMDNNVTIKANSSTTDQAPKVLPEDAVASDLQTRKHNATFNGNISLSSTSKPLLSIPCKEDEFQCETGQCVSRFSRCDSVFDCKGRSDEKNCVENKCMDNYQCHWSGNCLSRKFVCDGIKHCPDGEDETGCETWSCSEDEFRCSDGSAQTCIPISRKCDGHGDCLNRTDEVGCSTECPKDHFLCSEGSCIPNLWRCDGTPDCLDGADEVQCDCEGLDQFRCNIGGCVPKFKVCDGLRQCPDGSDEWGCLKIDFTSKQLHVKSNGNLWSTVCGDKWTSKWTDLACQQLGFGLSLSTEVRRISDSVLMPRVALSPDAPEVSRVGTTPLQYFLNPGECHNDPLVHLSCKIHECGNWNNSRSEAGFPSSKSNIENSNLLWPSLGLLVQAGSWDETGEISEKSCSATVITPTWILASYSCLVSKKNGLNAEKWALLIGDSTPKAGNEKTQLRYAKQVVVYPGAKRRGNIWEGDAVLIRLQVALDFEVPEVSPICLAEESIQAYDSCVIASWKADDHSGNAEGLQSSVRRQTIQNLPVPNLTKNTCNTSYFGGRLTQGHLCASFVQEKGSPCKGQEGSPLMCRRANGPWQLQGLLSHTGHCAASLILPSIFTDVSTINSWLLNTIGRRYDSSRDETTTSLKAMKPVSDVSASKDSSPKSGSSSVSSDSIIPLIPSALPLVQHEDSLKEVPLSNVSKHNNVSSTDIQNKTVHQPKEIIENNESIDMHIDIS